MSSGWRPTLATRVLALFAGVVVALSGLTGLLVDRAFTARRDERIAGALLLELSPLLAVTASGAAADASDDAFSFVERVAAATAVSVERRDEVERLAVSGAFGQSWLGLLETRVAALYPDEVVYLSVVADSEDDAPATAWRRDDAPSLIVQTLLPDGGWWRGELPVTVDVSTPARLALPAVVAFGAVAILVGWTVVRRALDPLSRLVRAAEALGTDLGAAPVEERGGRDLRRLAETLNRMQFRLQVLLEDRQQMLAAVSHDLKTPLTRLRLRAEKIDDSELRQRFAGDLDHLSGLVSSALALLRGDPDESPRPVDLQALVESTVDDMVEAGAAIEVEGTLAGTCRCRPSALRRCLVNLLDNAVRYGGAVSVTLEEADDRWLVVIRDAGPGIPEIELDRVFRPYYRGSAAKHEDGSGLGLTIARRIARQHGGDLRLENRSHGGLRARLEIPR